MKQVLVCMCIIMTFVLSACADREEEPVKPIESQTETASETQITTAASAKAGTVEAESEGKLPVIESTEAYLQETGAAARVKVTVGDKVYMAELEDNETAEELVKRMPLEFRMNELNGNEIFYNLSELLPADARNVGSIHAGDLMLYGDDCMVLFYEDFQTSFSYTRIGHLESADGLSDVIGSGDVTVRFETAK